MTSVDIYKQKLADIFVFSEPVPGTLKIVETRSQAKKDAWGNLCYGVAALIGPAVGYYMISDVAKGGLGFFTLLFVPIPIFFTFVGIAGIIRFFQLRYGIDEAYVSLNRYEKRKELLWIRERRALTDCLVKVMTFSGQDNSRAAPLHQVILVTKDGSLTGYEVVYEANSNSNLWQIQALAAIVSYHSGWPIVSS